LLDNIDTKLAELQDLDVETIVLERHLAKHSGDGNELTGKVLQEIELKMTKAYKEELDVLKRKIIVSNHKVDSDAIKQVNKAVDSAGVFLEAGREMVENVINRHLESEEHKHEHDNDEKDDHESHAEDLVSDYSDLLTDKEDMTKDEEEAIMEAITKDLHELEALEVEKEGLRNHFLGHLETKDLGSPHEMEIADELLTEINSKDLKDYQQTLKMFRDEVIVAKGKLNLTKVDQIISTLERVNIFVEANKDRMEVINLLDEEIESVDSFNEEERTTVTQEFDGDDGHFSVDDPVEAGSKFVINPVESYSEKVKEAIDKSAENSHKFLHSMNMHKIHGDFVAAEEAELEVLPAHLALMLFILGVFLLVVIYAAVRSKLFGNQSVKSKDKFEEIGGITSPTGGDKVNQFGCGNYMASTIIEDVNEEKRRVSKNWGNEWTQSPARMRKQKL